MSSSQWVQHISGQGQKWELHDQYTQANSFPNGTIYTVRQPDHPLELRLPRSEYRLCDPPETWVECTAAIEIGQVIATWFSGSAVWNVSLRCPDRSASYRLRKVRAIVEPNQSVTTWAFVVDQRVDPR